MELMQRQLPAPCVLNSRYLTAERFNDVVTSLGFTLRNHHLKQGGKMAYWLFEKSGADEADIPKHLGERDVLRTGTERNNFSILLG